MKTQIKYIALGLLALSSLCGAKVTMSWVNVGDEGNAADAATGGLYGAVDYNYWISAYEVTIGQYAEFLNAVAATDTYSLYNTSMGINLNAGISRSGSSGSYSYTTIDSANRPITYVSWNDAARFVNWMANGQGAGSTETGVYDMSLGGVAMSASSTSRYRLPTEDEWYKAAYYDPAKGETGGYWLHAMQSDTLVNNSTSANYYDGDYVGSGTSSLPSENGLTDVGSYVGQTSYYGTFDQGGNVFEWNDAVMSGSSRGHRGGSWGTSEFYLRSSTRLREGPGNDSISLGFRLASSVPEPSSSALICLGSLTIILRRKRG